MSKKSKKSKSSKSSRSSKSKKKSKIKSTPKIKTISAADDDIEKYFGTLEKSQPKKTTEWMTKYEYAKLIGCRSIQISQGAGLPPQVPIEDDYDPLSIAERELNARVIPLLIRRPLPDGTEEVWNPNEMHIRSY